MIDLKPINGMVMIEFEPYTESKTASGFLIAKPQHDEMPNRGHVLAVADGVDAVKVGDYVMYKVISPNGFERGGKKIIPVHIDDIEAIITED